MKLTKKEISLLIAAILMPGGGIVAGIYFLNSYLKQKREKEDVKVSQSKNN